MKTLSYIFVWISTYLLILHLSSGLAFFHERGLEGVTEIWLNILNNLVHNPKMYLFMNVIYITLLIPTMPLLILTSMYLSYRLHAKKNMSVLKSVVISALAPTAISLLMYLYFNDIVDSIKSQFTKYFEGIFHPMFVFAVLISELLILPVFLLSLTHIGKKNSTKETIPP